MKKISLLICLIFLISQNFIEVKGQTPQQRQTLLRLSDSLKVEAEIKKDEAIRFADSIGLPIRIEYEDGGVSEIIGIENGILHYSTTYNAQGAALIKSNNVYPNGSANLNLTGQGIRLGIWDGGRVLLNHPELEGRVTQIDNFANFNSHATHVSGTMMAAGINTQARGMAYNATLDAYEKANDNLMAQAAANNLRISNHSYGSYAGWGHGSESGQWGWHWHGDFDATEDYKFGFYNNKARVWDHIAYNAPNYLIVKAVGNSRDLGPLPGQHHYVQQPGQGWVESTTVRPPNGRLGGYDCIPTYGVAKNILTVGAVDGLGEMYERSSWGPADDGRIKPDVVAKGVMVFSSDYTGNQNPVPDYDSKTGTSMAAPMVSGSIGLLLQHQENLHPEELLLSSTLKALVIHSADDNISGAPGPDYRYGWGLMDTEQAAQIMTQDALEKGSHIRELSIKNGVEMYIPVIASNEDYIRATICWTDRRGNPAAPSLNPTDLMLVNDLDMRIIDPNGVEHFPYILDPNIPSAAATTGDNFRDNVEMVYLPSSSNEQLYLVKISHKGNLVGNSQQFSIIVTGGKMLDTGFQAIYSDPLSIDEWGNVYIDIIAPSDGQYKLNIWNSTGIWKPKWEWTPDFSGPLTPSIESAVYELTAGEEFTFVFQTKPSDESGTFRFRLHRKNSLGLFPVIDSETATLRTTTIVDKGLAYLASVQSTSKDMEYMTGTSIESVYKPIPESRIAGHWQNNAGITALALQAFLAQGHKVNDLTYGENVENAITYLLSRQVPSGHHAGAFGSSSYYGYETAMSVLALNMALNLGQLSEPLKSSVENAVVSGLNYYTQDVLEGWNNVSWRYTRNNTSQLGGDMSVNQWVYLALDALDYTDKDIWNKIYGYINTRKASSGNQAWIGYASDPGIWTRGNTCAAIWGLILANSHGVAGARPLADQMYNFLEQQSLNELFNPANISSHVFSGGGYYYYIYELAKALALGNKTNLAGGNWYDHMYNVLSGQYTEDANGNYYWTGWGGQGAPMSTALALLSLQTGTIPPGSTVRISMELSEVEKMDCVDFAITDQSGNMAGKIDDDWFTDIPESNWVSSGDGYYELIVYLDKATNFNVQIDNQCTGARNIDLSFAVLLSNQEVDQESFEFEIPSGATMGATAFINAIGGLNVVIVNPPSLLPVMKLDPGIVEFNLFEYNQTYNFDIQIKETTGQMPLLNIDIFSLGLTDELGNVIPGSNFSFIPNSIPEIPAGDSITIQATLITPESFENEDYGLFEGLITAQTNQQARAISFRLGAEYLSSHTILATTGPNGSIGPSGETSVPHGGSITYTIFPAQGHHLSELLVDGISIEPPVYSYTFSPVVGNHTIHAEFSKNIYTISSSSTVGGTISPQGLISVEYGENQTFTMQPDDGYHINDVLVDNISVGSLSSYTFYNVSKNYEIYAEFDINSYVINAIPNNNLWGNTSGGGVYQHDDTVNLLAIPIEGYSFLNWTENGEVISENPEFSFSADNDRTLIANFGSEYYTITLSADPSWAGFVTGGGNFLYGSEITIIAIGGEEWEFINWEENGIVVSESSAYSFTVTNDRSLIARFDPKGYEIEAAAQPEYAGIVHGQGIYEYGSIVTLIAIANPGWNFVNWTENGIVVFDYDEYTFTATSDKSFIANFNTTYCELYAIAQPLNGGNVNGTGHYPCDTMVALIAVPKSGYHFKQWTVDGDIVSQSPIGYFSPGSSGEIVAHFVNKDYILLSDYLHETTMESGFMQLTVTADQPWVATPEKNWLSVYPNYGNSGSNEVMVTWLDNPNHEMRESAIVFHNDAADATFLLKQGIPVSIPEVHTDEILVFPNPAKDGLNIHNIPHGAHFFITNVQGSEVLRVEQTEEKMFVDVSFLQPGFYNLVVVTRDRRIVKKVILF